MSTKPYFTISFRLFNLLNAINMKIKIDFSYTFSTAKDIILKYNQDPVIGKDDKPIIFRPNMELTFERLVKMMAAYNNKHPKLFEDGFFPTNNVAISTYTGFSIRTIQTHLKILQMAGLIVKPHEKWHGSGHGYEVALNPKLYRSYEEISPVVPPPIKKNLPHKELGTQNKLKDSYKVNKVSGQTPQTGPASRTLLKLIRSGNKGDKVARTQTDFSLPVVVPPAKFKGDKEGAASKTPGKARRAPSMSLLKNYIDILLRICVVDIYQNYSYLSETQIEIIRYFFYQKLCTCVTETEILQKHLELRTRLFMVKGWAERKPGRYIPLPHVYFDSSRAVNFDNTAEWYDHLKDYNQHNEKFRKRRNHFIRKRDQFIYRFKKYDSAVLAYNVW